MPPKCIAYGVLTSTPLVFMVLALLHISHQRRMLEPEGRCMYLTRTTVILSFAVPPLKDITRSIDSKGTLDMTPLLST